MKINFDAKYRPLIERGEYKVETADGQHSVRIICWDAAGSQRNDDIIALVKGTLGAENIQRYDVTGHLISDSTKRGNKDLVIVTPVSEPTKLERKLWEIFKAEGSPIGCIEEFTSDDMETLRSYAEELLDIAKEEIFSQESLVEYYEAAKKEGREEARKALPVWKRYLNGYYDSTPRISKHPETGKYMIEFGDRYIGLTEVYRCLEHED